MFGFLKGRSKFNDYKLRIVFALKKEVTRVSYKSYIYNQRLLLTVRQLFSYRLEKFLRNKFLTHIKNFCVLTGRSRGVYSKFRLSRIMLRNSFAFGLINNYRKSSW
jgi:ribosomal protein S14